MLFLFFLCFLIFWKFLWKIWNCLFFFCGLSFCFLVCFFVRCVCNFAFLVYFFLCVRCVFGVLLFSFFQIGFEFVVCLCESVFCLFVNRMEITIGKFASFSDNFGCVLLYYCENCNLMIFGDWNINMMYANTSNLNSTQVGLVVLEVLDIYNGIELFVFFFYKFFIPILVCHLFLTMVVFLCEIFAFSIVIMCASTCSSLSLAGWLFGFYFCCICIFHFGVFILRMILFFFIHVSFFSFSYFLVLKVLVFYFVFLCVCVFVSFCFYGMVGNVFEVIFHHCSLKVFSDSAMWRIKLGRSLKQNISINNHFKMDDGFYVIIGYEIYRFMVIIS